MSNPLKVAGWAVWPDQRITRRKLFHIVTDPTGAVIFKDRTLSACVEHLHEQGIEAYTLAWDKPERVLLRCDVHNTKEISKWQN